MLLRSTNKATNFRGLTNNHIFEAFRKYCFNQSMLLRSKTKPPFFSIRGRFDQTSFFMRGVIVPPSKSIVKKKCPPKGGVLFGGVHYEGGRSNQQSSFMRGVIVPPSKLVVKNVFPPQRYLFIRGGLLSRGGDYILSQKAQHLSKHVFDRRITPG